MYYRRQAYNEPSPSCYPVMMNKKRIARSQERRELSHLSVEKAVEQSHEESLEGRQEVGRIRPDGELDDGAIQRRLDHDQRVGDAQQWQQHHGCFNSFPVIHPCTY